MRDMGHSKPPNHTVFRVLVAVALLMATVVTDQSIAAKRKQTIETGQRRLSLGEAVAIALQRSLQLANSRLAVERKEHQRRAAFSDFFPTLDLQYTAFVDKYRQLTYELFAMAQDSRWSFRGGKGTFLLPDYPYRIDPYRTFTLQATITQPVYTAGKLLNNYKYARLGVDLSQVQSELQRQDLILAVHQAYYQLMLSKKMVEVVDESIGVLKSLRRQSQKLLEAHVTLKVDLLAIETQLAQAELRNLEARTNIEKHRAMLNDLLRYPQGSPTDVISDFGFSPVSYEPPAIYSVAASNRLEIRGAGISVEQGLAKVRASQADLLPQIGVQVQGSRINDDWNCFDPEAMNDWNIQGIVTWGFDMFRRRETVKDTRSAYAQAFISREQIVQEIMKEVQDAYLELKRSEEAIGINKRAMGVSRENFQAVKELYDGQLATYLEILSAESQMSAAQQAYYASLVTHRINTAILERKMGVLR